jgi:hypothetical protein
MAPVKFNTIESGGSGDYTTVTAWEVATDGDLVSSGIIEIGMVSGIVIGGAVISKSNLAFTDADFYRVLAPFSGTRHTGTSGTGSTVQISGGVDAFTLGENAIKISGLIIDGQDDTAVAIQTTTSFPAPSETYVIDGNIILNGRIGILVTHTGTTDHTAIIRNNIIHNTAYDGIRVADTGGATHVVDIHNNTIFGANHRLLKMGGYPTPLQSNLKRGGITLSGISNSSELKNNIVCRTYKLPSGLSVDNGDYAPSGEFTGFDMDNNASQDHTAPGTASISGVNPETAFLGAVELTADPNLHIRDSSSPLYNAGETQGAFSTDAVGTSRPQNGAWDIGALEFISRSRDLMPQDNNSGIGIKGTYRFHNATMILPSGSGFDSSAGPKAFLYFNPEANALFVESGGVGGTLFRGDEIDDALGPLSKFRGIVLE